MTLDVSIVPAVVTITNVSTSVQKVQMCGENIQQTMSAGDVLKLKATRSAELLYYTQLASSDITVTFAAAT
jgi:tRNA threonylcarbamoyladenosine modification (KEOPS) complex  Pcc1 subunit